MKVIVFGGSGFLGSHVADALTEEGHDVTIYDLRPSLHLKPNQKIVIGDILDERKVEGVIKGSDAVYNFAGMTDVDEMMQKPKDGIKSNILGNAIILEACTKASVKRFIFASSLYVYSKSGSFYRSSKQSCELIIENYNEVFGLPYTILRYGSLYGPRADDRNFIHKVIKSALKNGKIIREGDGEEIREYIHVFDAAKSSAEILSDKFKNQYVIITGNQQMKVKDLLCMIKEMLNNKVEIEYRHPTASSHYEITPYTFAPKLAKRIIGKSYVDLGQGIFKYMQNIYEEINPPPSYNGLVVKDVKQKKN